VKRCRRRPTLPRSRERSTIGAVGLNDRVRNGNECGPYALVASDMCDSERCGRSGNSNSLMKIVLALLADAWFPSGNHLGVVKPYGRLGPLRSEWIAPCPRAAYRRGGLPRPFKRLKASGEFILGRASHLDAFSGYHSRPSLPGAAPGGTTGTRAGRPTRSSRTRVRSPQLSNAHDGYRPNCLTTF
jgi:hypothetical protein